jgi:hypothetical protein
VGAGEVIIVSSVLSLVELKLIILVLECMMLLLSQSVFTNPLGL